MMKGKTPIPSTNIIIHFKEELFMIFPNLGPLQPHMSETTVNSIVQPQNTNMTVAFLLDYAFQKRVMR